MVTNSHIPACFQGTSNSFPWNPLILRPFDRAAFPLQISTWGVGWWRGVESWIGGMMKQNPEAYRSPQLVNPIDQLRVFYWPHMQYMQAWYEIIWNFRQRHLAQQEQDWKKVPCPHVSPGCQKAKGLVYSQRKFEPPPHRCGFFFQQTIWSQSDFHWCARAEIGFTAIGYKQCNHCSPALFFSWAPLQIWVKCYDVYRQNCQLPPFEDTAIRKCNMAPRLGT